MKEIKITDIENVRIGQVEDEENGTGCTVIIAENGAPCGLDVRGGGPASKESELLKPLANAQVIHAVVLGGGSAYGLEASSGVMEYLEEHDIGFDVGVCKVPLVCQSDIFDLTVANSKVRPNKQMGYDACVASESNNYKDGNYGAGCGATVGKFKGMDTCMKTGIGSYAVQIGDLKVGAIVVLNALGDVFDYKNGKKIAGLLSAEHKEFVSTVEEMYKSYEVVQNKFTGNTTIGIILTNGKFNKVELSKVAGMTHNGYARSIHPVHTSADGDSIYAMSCGTIPADLDMVGTLASDVMSQAIINAVYNAEGKYGYPSANDLK